MRVRNNGRSVTLSDVAKDAGVAPMTVSRYLNQHPNISEKTARKVSGAIKRLGYAPNMAARILMGQPSNTIGLVVPTLADQFFSQIAHSVQETARERGKLVWVAASNEDKDVEDSVIQQMRQHHVDGILLIPTSASSRDQILDGVAPIVALDRPVGAGSDAVVVDNRGGAARLVEHFIDHGYQRILWLSSDLPTIYTMAERAAGYEDVMRRHRLKRSVYSAHRSRHDLEVHVRAAWNTHPRPQAMLCANNVTTIQVLEVLLQLSLNLPQDIAIGGFDDFELAPFMRPGITVVRQPATELGHEAARILLERIHSDNGGHTPGMITTLPTSLIIRGSCGCKAPMIPAESSSE